MLIIVGWLFAGQAQALIGGSMTCSISAPSGYTVEPNTDMKMPMTVNCRTIRVFPYGFSINHELYHTSGGYVGTQLYATDWNTYFVPKPLGDPSEGCPSVSACGYLLPGAGVSFTLYLVGRTTSSPGPREVMLRLGYTAIGFNAYAEWVSQVNLRYTIRDTACTLSSPKSSNLSFGTISSSNLNNQTRSTSVQVSCPSAKSANVYLVPMNGVINASTGLAKTTLEGLNMQALWTSTSTAVALNSANFMQLQAGPNALNLTFKPQLASSQAPSGEFQSQYTLVIDYL